MLACVANALLTSVPVEAISTGTETLRSVYSVYVFKKFPSLLYQIDIFGFLQLDLITNDFITNK